MKQRTKKVFSLIIVIVLIASSISSLVYVNAAAYSYSYAVFSLDDRCLAVHEEASEDSDIIATLSTGAVCRVIERGEEWAKIFSGGHTGYVAVSKLTFSTSKLSMGGSYSGVAFTSDANIYSTPDDSSEIIAKRYSGATEVLSGDGGDVSGWTNIQIVIDSSGNTISAWVQNKYIEAATVLNDAEPYFADWETSTYSDAISALEFAESAKDTADSAISEKEAEEAAKAAEAAASQTLVTGNDVLSKTNGTVIGPSGKETYYNLDMSGVVRIMRNLGYSEEEYPYWVREDGCKMLGDYIMIAANLSVRPRGSLVETSLGTGIVADTGDFAYSNIYQIDIAVNW